MDLREYGVATHLYKPIVKRAVVDFAVGADWTPAAGDVKISKDGGAAANVTNLPVAIVMGNTAMWDYSLTATEMQAKQVKITVADSATKAVEDQFHEIETYGNASAQHAVNLNDAVRAGLTAIPNVASGGDGSLMVRGATQDVTLKSLSIVNSAGDALVLTANGGNGSGLNATGNGSGHGAKWTGGATGNGANYNGGATSGSAVKMTGVNGNAHALELIAQGSGSGCAMLGGATGHGLQCTGGGTSGQGIQAAAGGSGDGMRVTGTTNGHGFQALGAGTGRGIICTGGATGHGFNAIGGGTSGEGIRVTTTDGHAMNLAATGSSKHGLVATGGNAGVSDGIKGAAGTGGVDVRGQLADISVTTYAEPAAVPAATATIKDKISFNYALARNKRTTTATTETLRNDADAGTIGAATVSDDGVTFIRQKYA